MAISSGQVAVTSSGQAIVPAVNPNYSQSQGGYELATRDVIISNGSGAVVFLGPLGVTAGNGCPLAASTTVKLQLHLDEAVYGIVASTGTTVSFLATGT